MQYDKRGLRERMLARREALSPAEVEEKSRRIQERLAALPLYQKAREVLLYASFRNEVRTTRLLDGLWRRSARVLLPRLVPGKKGELNVCCVGCNRDLKPGGFGIPEPDPASCAPLDVFTPELAVIPGVAFDRDGARLGFGAGYYDRLLSRKSLQDTLLVGLAYSFQIVPELPTEAWDRPVHLIITEDEVIEVAP